MNKNVFAIIFLSLTILSFSVHASERSIKNYREQFCKDKPTEALQKQLTQVTSEIDEMVKAGQEACNQSGRQALSDCKSYRYGKIRKKIHKKKVILKAVERELQSRQN